MQLLVDIQLFHLNIEVKNIIKIWSLIITSKGILMVYGVQCDK